MSESISSQERSLWKIPASTLSQEQAQALQATLKERLEALTERYTQLYFASSLSAEDMVITDALSRFAPSVRVLTLNTGRLHQETIDMIGKVKLHYPTLEIKVIYPHQTALDQWTEQYGQNGFYENEEARKTCCYIRKMAPLDHALQTAQAWISGMRQSQSSTRADITLEQWDANRHLPKFNPIFDWSDEQMWGYLQHYEIILHPLHDKGYPSIGCEPCTRAIQLHENIRAGRWWWLQQKQKECGLHTRSS